MAGSWDVLKVINLKASNWFQSHLSTLEANTPSPPKCLGKDCASNTPPENERMKAKGSLPKMLRNARRLSTLSLMGFTPLTSWRTLQEVPQQRSCYQLFEMLNVFWTLSLLTQAPFFVWFDLLCKALEVFLLVKFGFMSLEFSGVPFGHFHFI